MKMLKDIYPKYQGGTDKGTRHSYIEVYDELLPRFVGKGSVLVELGVNTGESIQMWQEYLENGSIHGVDKLPMPQKLGGNPAIVHHQLDLGNGETLFKALAGLYIDVVIDDASHSFIHQLTAASVLIPMMRDDGIYVIEDFVHFPNKVCFDCFGDVEVIDRRGVKGTNDDVLVVIRNFRRKR